jgi:hypothetical protein
LTNSDTGLSFTTAGATLVGPLSIAQQPVSQSIKVGSPVTFSVTATGAPPIIVQWQRNGTNLATGTNFTLTMTNVQIADEGIYSAIISNSYGWLTTSNVTLIALEKPVVTVPPLGQTVVAGGTLALSAAATGHPLPFTFRWLSGGITLSTMVLAETNCFFSLTNVQPPLGTNQLSLKVNVVNAAGGVTSGAAIITVLPDTDGDGLPDNWELAYGLDPNNAADATLDPDADGVSNLQEYRAGTHPLDPLSFLRIGSISWNPNSGVSLRFNALSNKTYTVQSCSSVNDVPWTRVADIPAASSNRTVTIKDPAQETDGQRFYRLTTPRVE